MLLVGKSYILDFSISVNPLSIRSHFCGENSLHKATRSYRSLRPPVAQLVLRVELCIGAMAVPLLVPVFHLSHGIK